MATRVQELGLGEGGDVEALVRLVTQVPKVSLNGLGEEQVLQLC